MILWITSIFVLLVFISNLNSHNISPFFTQLHVHIYLHDMAEYISHTINVTPQRDTDGHNMEFNQSPCQIGIQPLML